MEENGRATITFGGVRLCRTLYGPGKIESVLAGVSPGRQSDYVRPNVSLLPIIEVIPHRSLIRSGNLILVQRSLCVALRGGDGFLIGD